MIIICEGRTEQEFCQKVLSPYLAPYHIAIQAPLIKKVQGGIANWNSLKKEIEIHLHRDKDAVVTTLLDYYGIKSTHDFPDWTHAETIIDKNERMVLLEKAMKESIADSLRHRFIPYLQLHEFEGLLFNDINIFFAQFTPDELVGKEELESTLREYPNPEMINNSLENSPGHRLRRIVKGYDKIVYGNCLAEAIGIDKIRKKSPRFNEWIERIIGCRCCQPQNHTPQ